jgi:hypothetical protein
VTYISSLLDANPTLYLDELQIKLAEIHDVDVSIATLSRAVWHLAITHKKVSKAVAERNELLQAAWQAEYGDIPAEYFVWLDETSVDDHTNQHTNRWAINGHACVRRATFIQGQQYSVLPTLTSEGYIALNIF